MISIVSRHLLESTFFCLLMSVIAGFVYRRPGTRYAVLLIGVAKFAIPSVLLASAGARLSVLWPAKSWLHFVAAFVSHAISTFFGAVLSEVDRLDSAAALVILSTWAVGAIFLFVIWLRRFRTEQAPLQSPGEDEAQALDEAKKQLPPRSPVVLRIGEPEIGPALHGLRRFTVVIPKGLAQQLTATELKAAILHELAHVRRFDNLAAAFAHSLSCLFWFHPLIWAVERQLIKTRERACDELVITSGILPATYVAAMVKVCRYHLSPVTAGASFMASSDVKRRLDLILNVNPAKRPSFVPRVMVVALVLLMAVLPIAGGYCEQCVSTGQDGAQQLFLRGAK